MKLVVSSSPLGPVQVESLHSDGTGVCYLPPKQGGLHPQKVYVHGLLPSEQALIQVEHQSPHTGDLFATTLERLNTAKERVAPVCAGYGMCGGCVLQHLQYEAQLSLKTSWVKQEFEKAGIQVESILQDCVPAPFKGLYGRRQMKLVATYQGGRLVLGSYQPRSHQVLDMQGCKLVDPELSLLASTTASLLEKAGISTYHESTRKGDLRYVILRASGAGSLQLLFVFAHLPSKQDLMPVVEHLAKRHPQLTSVVYHKNEEPGNALFSRGSPTEVLLGKPYLWEPIGSIKARISATSFVQANYQVAIQMYQCIVNALCPRPGDVLLDLYCGVGGIGFSAFQKEPTLTWMGIEENPSAVEDAKASLHKNQIDPKSAQFLCGDVEKIERFLLQDLQNDPYQKKTSISLVTLNPPRKGTSPSVVRTLTQLSPRTIVYMSCNPTTLVRDLALFQENAYQLTQVVPFDLHPHTTHTEVVAVLKKGG